MNWESFRAELLSERARIDAVLAALPPSAATLSPAQVAELAFGSAEESAEPPAEFAIDVEELFADKAVCEDLTSAQELEELVAASPQPPAPKPRRTRQEVAARAEDRTHSGTSATVLEALRLIGPALSTPVIDKTLQLKPSATREQVSSAIFYLMSRGKIRKDGAYFLHLNERPQVN